MGGKQRKKNINRKKIHVEQKQINLEEQLEIFILASPSQRIL